MTSDTARTPASSAFKTPLMPSAALAVIVGPSPLPRTEVTRKLWSYIKAQGLQSLPDKRMVQCDLALQAVTGKPVVSMFEMTALVSQHLKPLSA